ncbi:hypothetical protein SteCoe_28488 [Stentor coeruleus]|uniref:GAR domain-containing protein n=1 Tax=Stentor coeruleus TaxID=5963 RepID=A0A1R2B869_9CILI|nr:hypothetical protein SteCoe_28488 [Stentor coeruleus]
MISLIKLEGTLDDATCYVTINNQLADILTDFNSQPTFEISESGVIKIIVKNSKDQLLGTASVDCKILPLNLPQWIPLTIETDQKCPLPEYIEQPRILLLYSSNKLPSVTEVTEYSSVTDTQSHLGFDELFTALTEKNNGLRDRVAELENEIMEKKWKHAEKIHNCINDKTEETTELIENLDKMKNKCDQLTLLKNELENRANSLEMLYKQEKYQREYLEKQINRVTQEYEELLQAESKKMMEYKNEISSLYEKLRNTQENLDSAMVKLRDCEIQRDDFKRASVKCNFLQNALDTDKATLFSLLQEKFEDSEFQRKILAEKLENISSNKSEEKKTITISQDHCANYNKEFLKIKEMLAKLNKKVNSLESELEVKNYEILKLEHEKDKLRISCSDKVNSLNTEKDFEIQELKNLIENIKKHNENLKNTICLLTDQIKIISEKLIMAKQKNYELTHNNRELPFDKNKLSSGNADERFIEYMKCYGIHQHFQRVAEGVYTFGCKKVSVTIKNGYLVCRVGGGYMMIEEFLMLFMSQELKNELNESSSQYNTMVSPNSKSPHKKSVSAHDCNSEEPHTDRILSRDYSLSTISYTHKENQEESPPKARFSPVHKRSFTPLRKSMPTRIYK